MYFSSPNGIQNRTAMKNISLKQTYIIVAFIINNIYYEHQD